MFMTFLFIIAGLPLVTFIRTTFSKLKSLSYISTVTAIDIYHNNFLSFFHFRKQWYKQNIKVFTSGSSTITSLRYYYYYYARTVLLKRFSISLIQNSVKQIIGNLVFTLYKSVGNYKSNNFFLTNTHFRHLYVN